MGRWLTRDPIGYAGGINLYGYVGNSPINGADPTGYKTTAASVGGFIDDLGFGGAFGEFGSALNRFKKGPQCYQAAATEGLTAESNLETSIEMTFLPAPKGFGRLLKGPCFLAGTPVQMANGTTKRIEQVKAGDVVESRNIQTGKTEAKLVARTYVKHADQLVAVRLSDGEKITCTPEHPFFVQGIGFVNAGDLASGMAVSTGEKTALTVSGIDWQKEAAGGYTVYNFEVAGDHTYFVGKQAGGVWVHNDCTKIAEDLQAAGNAGEIWRVKPHPDLYPPANDVGPYKGVPTYGAYHDVLYDPDSGTVRDPMLLGHSNPVPFNDWWSGWDYRDVLTFGPKP